MAIQTNFITQHNSDRMAHAICHSGGVPLSVQLSSFDDSLTFNLSDPPLDNFVIPYGSTKLIRLGIERGWLGCFFNDNFDVVKWNANRNDMLNFDSAIVAAKDIPVWLTIHLIYQCLFDHVTTPKLSLVLCRGLTI